MRERERERERQRERERERQREIGSKNFIVLINSLNVSDARKSFIQQFSMSAKCWLSIKRLSVRRIITSYSQRETEREKENEIENDYDMEYSMPFLNSDNLLDQNINIIYPRSQ